MAGHNKTLWAGFSTFFSAKSNKSLLFDPLKTKQLLARRFVLILWIFLSNVNSYLQVSANPALALAKIFKDMTSLNSLSIIARH